MDEIRLVRHRDDAQATRRAKARDGLNHKKRVRWIERRCRLVEEKRLRVAQQCPRDRHALLLAPGERHRFTVEKRRLKSDFIECRSQSVFREVARTPAGRMQRLSRTVPSNITGVCMTSATRHRSSRGSNDRVSRPSNRTVPEDGSTRRLRQRSTVDFPEPDGPTSVSALPTLYAERDIIQDVNCGMPATPG